MTGEEITYSFKNKDSLMHYLSCSIDMSTNWIVEVERINKRYTITETHEMTGEEIKASFTTKDQVIGYLMQSLEMSSNWMLELVVA